MDITATSEGESVTSFRGVKSSERVGIRQGSKMSPLLFSFYIADMPTPTEPVNRVRYADHINRVGIRSKDTGTPEPDQ